MSLGEGLKKWVILASPNPAHLTPGCMGAWEENPSNAVSSLLMGPLFPHMYSPLGPGEITSV